MSRPATCVSWKPRLPHSAAALGAVRRIVRLHPFVNEKERTMRPTTADDNVFDFNALLHPGTVFETPRDVVKHPCLTKAEKRAILASWASDASAIASCPSLRAPIAHIATTSAAIAGCCALSSPLWSDSILNGDFPRRRLLCKAFPLRPSRSSSRSHGLVDHCQREVCCSCRRMTSRSN